MKVRVLGCSGGIYQGVATTSFLVDDDILNGSCPKNQGDNIVRVFH